MRALRRLRLIEAFHGFFLSMLSVARRIKAKLRAEWSLRRRQRSSSKLTSSCQWRLFSIAQCERTALRMSAGSGGNEVM